MNIEGKVVLSGAVEITEFEEYFTKNTLSYASSYDVRNGVQMIGYIECGVDWGTCQDSVESIMFDIDTDVSCELVDDNLKDFLNVVEEAASEQGLKVLRIEAQSVDYDRQRLCSVQLDVGSGDEPTVLTYDSPERLPWQYKEIDKLFNKLHKGVLDEAV